MEIPLIKLVDLIQEGGNAFEGTVGIKQSEVQPTVEAIFSEVLEPLGLTSLGDDVFLMGSAGKKPEKELSGDLDIAIYTDQIAAHNSIKLTEVLDWVTEELEGMGYPTAVAKGFNQVSFPFQIVGRKGQKFVQVDLLFTSNMAWSKFMHTSPNLAKGESKYKNAYRNLLLASCVSAFYHKVLKKTSDDIPLEIERYSLRLNAGIYKIRQSYAGTRVAVLKTPKTIKSAEKLITAIPEELIEIVFGKKYSVADVATFEKLYDLVFHKKTKITPHREKIKKNFLYSLKASKFPVPELVEE